LLGQQAVWKQAQSILFYAPIGHELDLWPLLIEALAIGKTVALPSFNTETNFYTACQIREPARDLKLGKFGIREPAEHCSLMAIYRLDLVLVPGIAFDLHGHRLGRGKGFYDLLLTLVRGTTCGVAFDEQIVSEIPVESHDISVNCILTPTRWIEL
jgi:5-formyltetrahydrofolate cyclo-ligase